MSRPVTDLRRLLNARKFIPPFLERSHCPGETLGPHSVELHLSSSCNYRCLHCSYSRRNKEHHGRLDEAVVDRLVYDLAAMGARGVYLAGGGEPTMLPGWDDHVLRLDAAGVSVALVTNGTRLPAARPEVLHALSYVAVSVYSTRAGVYEAVTGGRAFEDQFAVPSLYRVDRRTVVGARCVVNPRNADHVAEVYDAAMDAGFDYVIFVPEVDYEGRGGGLGPEHEAVLRGQIEARGADLDPARTNLAGLPGRGFRHYAEAEVPPGPCRAVDLRTNAFVNYDGAVYLCQPLIGQREYSIGSVADAPLPELWNGPGHRKVIRALQDGYPLDACRVCRCLSYNRTVAHWLALAPNEPFEVVRDPFL